MEVTWDLIILAGLAGGILYGAFFGRNKIVGIVVNLILAFAFTTVVGETVYNWVANFGFVSNQLVATQFGASTVVFALTFFLLLFKSETAGLDSAGSIDKIWGGIYGFFASGLVLSSLLSFMTETQRISLDSNFANLVHSWHSLWIAGPILLLITGSFIKR